jgi:hypothetical protein
MKQCRRLEMANVLIFKNGKPVVFTNCGLPFTFILNNASPGWSFLTTQTKVTPPTMSSKHFWSFL